MWLACVHFNRLFYSDSNDVWIVWGLWGLFSQVVNSLLLCSTLSVESLAYLLCSLVSAHSHLPIGTRRPRLQTVCVRGLCVHMCMHAVCMYVCGLCVVCMYVCHTGKSSAAEKGHRLTLPGCYLLTYLHGL